MIRARLILSIATASLAFSVQASPLDDLLQRLKSDQVRESQEIQERLQRFRSMAAERKALLDDVQAQIKAEEKRSQEMEEAFREGEKSMIEKREKLDELTAHYKEVYATAKLWAVELREQFTQSIISAQSSERITVVEPLSRDDHSFTVDDMKALLYEALNEAHQQGKVVRFPATVTLPDGTFMDTSVVRAGPFTASSGNQFLSLAEDTSQLRVLPRQPRNRFRDIVADMETSGMNYPLTVIDPSRGAILSLLVDAPTTMERIHQGGLIGYLIIAIGIFGVLFALFRSLALKVHLSRIRKQQRDMNQPHNNNALGRIARVFHDCGDDIDTEAREDRVHEKISEELPKLNWGLGMLRVLAAIAPLLGLLGTVTGMIQTFQDITLFGTGEPRMMAGGISQALITTALGLSAAIPILLILTAARAYSTRIRQIVEEQSLGLLTRAQK